MAMALGNILKSLINGKEDITSGAGALADPAHVDKIVANALSGFSALSISAGVMSPQEMQAALILASILKNPTDDQKDILSIVSGLLKAVNSVEDAQAQSLELKKASDDFLQAVAAVLIAQAIPDLLKEGDVTNIKSIFAELNTEKGKAMLQYQESVKPYYEEIANEFSKNMNILQLKNILSKSMTKEELENLPPNELEKILEKVRQAKDKSFETEYILQQEAKYRKTYLDPGKKMLDARIKSLLESFTKKLSGVLDGVKAEKK